MHLKTNDRDLVAIAFNERLKHLRDDLPLYFKVVDNGKDEKCRYSLESWNRLMDPDSFPEEFKR